MAATCHRCSATLTPGARFCLQCGAMVEVQVEESGDPLLGKIIAGRYRVVSLIGEGGMGRVYLAEQKMGAATRKVAIKTLHPELSADPQLVARFHRECETVIELHHPNTIQFYDFGELEDRTLYVVMEFIEGAALASILEAGPLDPTRADRIIIQICGSLHEAHQRGIVHRDLKPDNVLLTNRGGQMDFVKVLDFGIAKRSEAEDQSKTKLTKQGMVLGTPPYMSPEQFSGQQLDARSDIYSLGIMAYEMLSGRLPFDGKTPWEWATKHLTAVPAPLELDPRGASLPPNKRSAIMRALAKDRDQRHATVMEFSAEFTGMHDSQAAWTMATSGSVMRSAGYPSAQQGGAYPSPAQGTNTPYPQQGGYASPTAAYNPTPASGSHQVGGYGTPYGSQGPSGEMPIAGLTKKNTPWGLIAVLLVLAIAGTAAGSWFVFSGDDEAQPVSPGVLPATNNATSGADAAVAESPDAAVVDPPVAAVIAEPATRPTTPTKAVTERPAKQPSRPSTPTHTPTPAQQPSNADPARVQALASMVQSAIDGGNWEIAAANLATVQGLAGRNDASVTRLRQVLSTRGSNLIGSMIMRGDCDRAREIYQALRQAGAERTARSQFRDYCPLPN
jgi:serine/threonine protein kinase